MSEDQHISVGLYPLEGDNISRWMWRNLSGDPPKYRELYIDIEDTTDRYVIPTICLLGIVGNLVNLVVLTRSRFRDQEAVSASSANTGLVALSVADLLFCLAMFPRGFVRSTHSLFPSRSFPIFYQAYGTGLVTTFILTSTWITVTMAMLRYLGICHPLRSRRIMGPYFAKMSYGIATFTCAVFNLPSFLQYRITEMPMSENETFYLIDIGYMDTSERWGITFAWAKFIFGVFAPTSVLVFCNYSLIVALKRSKQMRRKCFVKENASSSGNRVTLTLITIVTSFVVLVFPSELMDFFLECIKMDVTKTEVFLLVRSLANTLQVLNFSCNFFLYCSVNNLFRTTVLQLIRCRQYRPEDNFRVGIRRQSCNRRAAKTNETRM